MYSFLPNERQLWQNLSDGDRCALDALYKLHFRSLYNYGRKLHYDIDLVRDCIQDLYVEIWQQRTHLSIPHHPKMYLLKSLRYKIFYQAKKQFRIKSLSSQPDQEETLADTSDEPSSELADRQKKAIHESFKRLTDRQKRALLLRYYEGMESDEIAQIMELKVQSVYNLIHQGLQKMRENINTNLVFVDCIVLVTALLTWWMQSVFAG